MKIIADSAVPFLRGVLEPYAEVRYLPGRQIAPEAVRDADALIVRTRTRCDETLLAGSSVRLVATATIGFDHIDTAWCAAHGIRVATAAGCNARGVLQWVAAVLAHLARTQGWVPSARTLGIVGVGHVGSLVKEYAEAWGFRVVCCDPPREAREHLGFRPLEEVAAEADLITFHTPLDASTRRMAGEALFAHMKPSAVVINSSRGEVVEGGALLHSGLACVLADRPRPARTHAARHPPYRRLLGTGQSQCHGARSAGRGRLFRSPARHMVSARGAALGAAARKLARDVRHDQRTIRHRSPKSRPEKRPGIFRIHARRLPLPRRVLLTDFCVTL